MEYDFDELQRVAERMWKDNFFFMYRWSPETSAVWLRHNCKCVYCDRDLLENRDIAYFFSDREHVLPKSKYPSLEFDPNNIVVACAACNTIKGDWNPNGQMPLVEYDVQHLTDSQREELVTRSRHYVEMKKAETEPEFRQEKELILAFLKNHCLETVGA